MVHQRSHEWDVISCNADRAVSRADKEVVLYLGLSSLFGIQLQRKSQTRGGLKVSVDVE